MTLDDLDHKLLECWPQAKGLGLTFQTFQRGLETPNVNSHKLLEC